MKSLIVLVVGLLAVGCATMKDICVQLGISKASSTEMFPEPDPPLPREIEIRDSMIGEYESIYNGNTYKRVFLDNGINEYYVNGKKGIRESKWSIVDGEIHFKKIIGSQMMGNSLSLHETYLVWRINTDKSITDFAFIIGGKRTDFPKEAQKTYKKIK